MSRKTVGFQAIQALFILAISVNVWAQQGPYQEGIHFTVIENAKPVEGDNVRVVEAFSYMCTHCATFEPYISGWIKRKPENVVFARVPVVFGRGSWELYARAYVTAEVMGIADKSHEALMDKIWKDQKVYRTIEELGEFYSAYGVAPASFVATSKSFAVDAKLRKDQRVVQEAGVRGTPSLIVNNKYLVAGNAAVGSYDVMLDVVDYLIAEETVDEALGPGEPAPETVEAQAEAISAEAKAESQF